MLIYSFDKLILTDLVDFDPASYLFQLYPPRQKLDFQTLEGVDHGHHSVHQPQGSNKPLSYLLQKLIDYKIGL